MRSMFYKNLQTSGKKFTVQRTSEIAIGILVNQNCQHIDFPIELDLHSNDWVINSIGEKLFITEIQDFSPYKSCYYITEFEYNKQTQANNIFNINADKIENSIFGTQQNAVINVTRDLDQMRQLINDSSSPDKEELHQLVSLLEIALKSQEPIPKGFLSKFSSVMERNSWITGAVAGFLLNMLQIPFESLLP